MKYFYIPIILLIFVSTTGFSQKKIIGTPIEGTNLFIEAEAETVSKVTFKIKKNLDEKINNMPDETLNPFNKFTFKSYLESVFIKIKDNDKIKFEDNLREELKIYTDQKKNDDNYYKIKSNLSDKMDYLYNYFNAQLLLIFRYDNEPIAGRLFYKTHISKIQYFPKSHYETYFNNRTRNYHNLINKLYLDRINFGKKNNGEVNNDLERRILKQQQKIKYLEDTLHNLFLYKKYNLKNNINKHSKECINQLSNLEIYNVQLLNKYEETIVNHFKNEGKEYKSKYIKDPKEFLCSYLDIINNFRNYNRGKRLGLIKNRIIQSKNNEIYKTINITDFEDIESEQKKYLDLYEEIIEIEKAEKEGEKKLRDFNLEYANIILERDVTVNKLDEVKRKIKEKEELFNIEKSKLDDSLVANLILGEYNYDEKPINSRSYFAIIGLNEQWIKLNSDRDFILLRIKDLSIEKERIILKREQFFSDYNPERMKLKKKEIVKSNIHLLKNKINKDSDSILKIKEIVRRRADSLSEELNIRKLQIIKALKEAPLWEFKATDIQLDINDGFVEHIVVLGDLLIPTPDNNQSQQFNDRIKHILDKSSTRDINEGRKLKFVNKFPIGFTSSKDFDDLKEYKLIVYNGKHKQFEMRLGDLFTDYLQTLANDRLDFSPADQVVKLPVDNDSIGSIELKKDKSSKLFNLKTYADFNGLKETDPNGVIQFEVDKLIPLYTKRNTWLFGERYFNRGFNYGYLNYIQPQFRWSRLNDNNDDKNLTLSYLPVFNGSATDSISYVTQLNLLRYENISVGADLNILSLDFPTSKIRIEANVGGRYARTRVLDTKGEPVDSQNADGQEVSNVLQTYNVNTWRYYPELIFRLRPEERYGANIGLRAIRFNSVTEDFSNTSSEEEFTTTLTNNNQQWLHQIEINAHFSPSARKNDRFFFRYRYTNTSSWEYNGFSEIQLGYSLSLKF